MRAIHIEQSITSRDEHSLNRYLLELDKTELISAEVEIELARKIKNGDTAALDRLVKANLRFVVSCAKKYANLGLPLSDLINEGNIGLIKAAKLFDETKGFKFISYAVWWIRQAMTSALSEHVRMIRLPANMIRVTSDIRKMAEKLEQQLERSPVWEEITQELYVPAEEFSRYYAFDKKTASLDMEVSESGNAQLWSLLEDPNSSQTDMGIEIKDSEIRVAGMLSVLSQREHVILDNMYGLSGQLPLGVRDIAPMLGISYERVRQVKEQALSKLRKKFAGKGDVQWAS